MRNVNVKGRIVQDKATPSFILTMRNVNSKFPLNTPFSIFSFILTMRNVNLVTFNVFVSGCVVLY